MNGKNKIGTLNNCNQEPNKLTDRKALENIIFDGLELTEDEIKEVYRAIVDLLRSRL